MWGGVRARNREEYVQGWGQGCIGTGEVPPPPLQSAQPALSYVFLRASASFNGTRNRHQPPSTALATSSNRLPDF